MTDGPKESASILTRVGHAGWEDHRHFGCSVFSELLGFESYTGLMALAVTGRRLPPEQCCVLDDIACVLTVADPRIWPPKAIRVASSYGSLSSSLAVGCFFLESRVLGPWTSGFAAKFLEDIASEAVLAAGEIERIRNSIASVLNERGRLIGFGVPFRRRDERLEALRRSIELRGRHKLPYWQLFEIVADIVGELSGLAPNIGIGVAAACLDLGFEPEEISPLVISLNLNVLIANAVEGCNEEAACLRRMPDARIEYLGKRNRTSPRSNRSQPGRE